MIISRKIIKFIKIEWASLVESDDVDMSIDIGISELSLLDSAGTLSHKGVQRESLTVTSHRVRTGTLAMDYIDYLLATGRFDSGPDVVHGSKFKAPTLEDLVTQIPSFN
ncbi:hypothetical protein AOL_s00078g515 [Orbilia oligospora ATCC 24927]|uniref:Uncharacterized protein n=1 Tax=Arthrobotrys oligospora (strain ATCC 24927 / CBS 115.81 / DSM 1491) TaxID=756982 RepID=G1XC68_ARTOA|nr:hypothetical protein AOL_s00078g515 [Orbilia oligospora ATCC 24927]EGX49482.1 hypothetical protein AOL_s00078g515 [Orbilia oligospora ATCC 24927]